MVFGAQTPMCEIKIGATECIPGLWDINIAGREIKMMEERAYLVFGTQIIWR